jgi:hypothetical protein
MRTVIHRYFTQLGEVEVNLLELVKVPAGKALFINDEYRSHIEIPNASLDDLMDWQRGIKLVSQV